MTRYKLLIEFDGTPYAGWQRQKNAPSVQHCVEAAVLAFCGETVTLGAAGRTDAGVHATEMVAHVDIQKTVRADQVRDGLNFHLGDAPIVIRDAVVADDDFHARFNCTGRHYRYDILNRRAPAALARNRAWHVIGTLDVVLMAQAAQCLVGRHDFTTFRASQCQAESPVKTLNAIAVARQGEIVKVTCHARSFLHHQVRSMVGSLVMVGRGRWSSADFEAAFKACDRTRCGPVAPPDGLYFVKADYP
ncbi:MAG: tRNA pseudouridine(38-40) synthase TruA [Pseudomonadota bacterium]